MEFQRDTLKFLIKPRDEQPTMLLFNVAGSALLGCL